MEDGAVFQNSTEMKKIADEINSDAEELQKLTSEMYELLETELGESDNGQKAWFGPKASMFLQNIKNKRKDFDAQSDNIKAISRNLNDQAQAWENFEK